jgi:signal transduction histidine kinase
VLIDTNETDCFVKVMDEGIGISQEDIPYLFDPFYRSSHTSDVPGFGIGLSICQRIIDLHHGSITVISEPGKGSEFRVQLKHM